MGYSPELKEAMLRRLLPPNNESVTKVSREEGIPQQTLNRWKNEAKANGGVAKEAAALLVLSKKANAIWGGHRGRKISASDCSNAILLINEAVESGASLSKACERLGITERTYYRWVKLNKTIDSYEDRRIFANHSNLVNKITPAERQDILDTVNSEEFASMPPCQIVPTLADQGTYIASERTFYRVLHEEKMQNHRGRSQEPYVDSL